jgi:hypothetical protein
VAQQIKIRQTKVKTCGFGPAIFHRMMSLVKGTAQHTKMSSGPVFIRINVMILLLPVSDWSTIIIHPSGLLLVVRIFCSAWFSFMGEIGAALSACKMKNKHKDNKYSTNI